MQKKINLCLPNIFHVVHKPLATCRSPWLHTTTRYDPGSAIPFLASRNGLRYDSIQRSTGLQRSPHIYDFVQRPSFPKTMITYPCLLDCDLATLWVVLFKDLWGKLYGGGVGGGGGGQRRGKLPVERGLRTYCWQGREIELELIVWSWWFGRVS